MAATAVCVVIHQDRDVVTDVEDDDISHVGDDEDEEDVFCVVVVTLLWPLWLCCRGWPRPSHHLLAAGAYCWPLGLLYNKNSVSYNFSHYKVGHKSQG